MCVLVVSVCSITYYLNGIDYNGVVYTLACQRPGLDKRGDADVQQADRSVICESVLALIDRRSRLSRPPFCFSLHRVLYLLFFFFFGYCLFK